MADLPDDPFLSTSPHDPVWQVVDKDGVIYGSGLTWYEAEAEVGDEDALRIQHMRGLE